MNDGASSPSTALDPCATDCRSAVPNSVNEVSTNLFGDLLLRKPVQARREVLLHRLERRGDWNFGMVAVPSRCGLRREGSFAEDAGTEKPEHEKAERCGASSW